MPRCISRFFLPILLFYIGILLLGTLIGLVVGLFISDILISVILGFFIGLSVAIIVNAIVLIIINRTCFEYYLDPCN